MTTMSGDPWNAETFFPMAALSANCGSAKTDKYRDHLLRLDPESRHKRFGGAVSDEFIVRLCRLSISLDAVVHGFFVDGVLRGAAELRPARPDFPRQARSGVQRREAVAKPRRRLGAARAHVAGGPQPRHPVCCTWHALLKIGACNSLPASSTPNSASISAASSARSIRRADAAVADAGTDGRRPWLRRRRCSICNRGCCERNLIPRVQRRLRSRCAATSG